VLFLKPPKNLVFNILLNSVTLHNYGNSTSYNIRKDSSSLSFPLRLSLDSFLVKQCDVEDYEQIEKINSVKESTFQPEVAYELYGVVNHSGSMGGGHYT
jgi:ubiquitin C-terminal hydrolase